MITFKSPSAQQKVLLDCIIGLPRIVLFALNQHVFYIYRFSSLVLVYLENNVIPRNANKYNQRVQ